MALLKDAYANEGAQAALAAYGVKTAGWGDGFRAGMTRFSRAAAPLAKTLGFLPTGIGNAASAIVGGGANLASAIANKEPIHKVIGRTALGVGSGFLPFGTGIVADYAGNALLDRL